MRRLAQPVDEPYRPATERGHRDLFSLSGWLLVNNALNFTISLFPHFLRVG